MIRRFGRFYLALVAVLLLAQLACVPPRLVLAVDETPVAPVVVIPPYPTQIPYPTVVSQQGAVGLATVSVGTGQGSQGWLMLIAAIQLFGFTVIALLLGLHLFMRGAQ